jgi:hypothetical protein
MRTEQLTIISLQTVSQDMSDLRKKKFLMQVLTKTHSYLWTGHTHTECATVVSLHIHNILKAGFITGTAVLQTCWINADCQLITAPRMDMKCACERVAPV